MKAVHRIQRLLAPFQEIIKDRPFFVYDRSLKVRYANMVLAEATGYPASQLSGRSVTTFIRNGICTRLSDVKIYLRKQYHRFYNNLQFVITANQKNLDHRVYMPPDECGGRAIRLQVCTLDENHTLGVIFFIFGKVYRRMGQVSSDVMVTVNEKNRVVSFNEVFFWLAEKRPMDIFNKPLQSFFANNVSHAFRDFNRKSFLTLQRQIQANDAAWANVFSGALPWRHMGQWKRDKNLRMSPEAGAIRIDCSMPDTFINWKQPVDHARLLFQRLWNMRGFFDFHARHHWISYYFDGVQRHGEAAAQTMGKRAGGHQSSIQN